MMISRPFVPVKGEIDDARFGAMKSTLVKLMQQYVNPQSAKYQQFVFLIAPDGSVQRPHTNLETLNPTFLCHLIANLMPLSPEELQLVLEIPDEFTKMKTVVGYLRREAKVSALREEVIFFLLLFKFWAVLKRRQLTTGACFASYISLSEAQSATCRSRIANTWSTKSSSVPKRSWGYLKIRLPFTARDC